LAFDLYGEASAYVLRGDYDAVVVECVHAVHRGL
jgi:hypothetical protein